MEAHIEPKKILRTSLILLSLLLVGSVILFFEKDTQANNQEVVISDQKLDFTHFENMALEARAVYVWNAKNKKVLYSKNSDEILPLASLSKVMTALVAKNSMSEKYIQIGARDLAAEGDHGLMGYETWKVDDLIDFMLVVSSNDSAHSLASAYSATNNDTLVSAMNEKARQLGLSTMKFSNPSGLDSDDLTESGGYGSVRDIVLLFDHILEEYPTLLEATRESNLVFKSESNIEHLAQNTNDLVDTIPFIIGSKTGFTDLAGGNLVIAFDSGIGETYIIGVLGSSLEGRFSDMELLYNATIEHIHKRP